MCDIVCCNLKTSLCSLPASILRLLYQMDQPSSTSAPAPASVERSGGSGAPQDQLDDRRLWILVVLRPSPPQPLLRRYTASTTELSVVASHLGVAQFVVPHARLRRPLAQAAQPQRLQLRAECRLRVGACSLLWTCTSELYLVSSTCMHGTRLSIVPVR